MSDCAGWQSEGVAVTSAGRLPCQKIFHLYAARSDVNAWRAVIGRCFTEADRAGVKSLAMPPVGTGMSHSLPLLLLECSKLIHNNQMVQRTVNLTPCPTAGCCHLANFVA